MNQGHEIEWRDGRVPVSVPFGDPFYSLSDGLAEARHVFLAGNDLPRRFRPGFHIAELGFGTGLNAVAAWMAWRASGCAGALRFTSFEAFPLSPGACATALDAFPEARPFARRIAAMLAAAPAGMARLVGEDFDLTVMFGDARATLPGWPGRADAWFLDGFAPARNPELWDPALMRAVADHTAPGGRFATYTAAGAVRRRLAGAGFTVTRVPGFGRKRHMTVGRLP